MSLSAFDYVLLAWGSTNALVLLVALLLNSRRLRRRSLRRRRRGRPPASAAPGQDVWTPGRDARS